MAAKRPPQAIIDAALSFARRAWEESSWAETMLQKWSRDYDQYRGVLTRKQRGNLQTRAKVFMQETFHDVETVVPRIVDGVIGADPFFEFRARGPEDRVSAMIHEAYVRWQLDRAKYKRFFTRVCRNGAIYGNGFGKVAYERRVMNVGRMPGTSAPGLTTTYTGPVFYSLSPNRLRVSKNATGMQLSDGALFVVDRLRKSRSELMALQRSDVYFGVEDLPDPRGVSSMDDTDSFEASRAMTAGMTPPGDEDQMVGRYDVLEFWGQFELHADIATQTRQFKRGETIEAVITTVGLEHVIRVEPNPFDGLFRPFLKFDYLDLDGEFYGVGLPESTRGAQDALNALINMRLDNISNGINVMHLVDHTAGITEDRMHPRPWGWIQCENIQGTKPLDVPDRTGSSFVEQGSLQDMMRRTTGAVAAISGDIPSKRVTATENVSNVSEAGQRLSTVIHNAERFLVESLEMVHLLNMQFVEEEEIVRVTGPKGLLHVPHTPEDARKFYDIFPTGSRAAGSRAARVGQLLQFIQMGSTLEQLNLQKTQLQAQGIPAEMLVDWKRVVQELMKTIGFGDTEGFFQTEPEEILQRLQAEQGPDLGGQIDETILGREPLPTNGVQSQVGVGITEPFTGLEGV